MSESEHKKEDSEVFQKRIHTLFNPGGALSAEAMARLAYYEIKTPLAAIQGFAAYMQKKSSADVRDMLLVGTAEKGMTVGDLLELTLDMAERINFVATEMLKSAMAQRNSAPASPDDPGAN